MRILFALSGLHRIDRGAEVAFTAVANELARAGDEVTLIGSGADRADVNYRFISVPTIDRARFEGWPSMPMFRDETAWEDACFMPGLLKAFDPRSFDVTLTCAYPFTNWALRRPSLGRRRPPHVFVTQNGDWPAFCRTSEYRFFGCEGLICINPDYYARNEARYPSALIPNGVDLGRFYPGPEERRSFGLPLGAPVVLMVSALIPSKNVAEGIKAVARLPNAHLVIAGDGPLRSELQQLAELHLPGRYLQITISASRMPALYRSADVFLHLSRTESFGNVFIEALATGLPVVAYDIPRTRWILGEVGELVAGDDCACIAAQIVRALESRQHSHSRRLERAATFDWTRIAARYRDFLAQIVARNVAAR